MGLAGFSCMDAVEFENHGGEVESDLLLLCCRKLRYVPDLLIHVREDAFDPLFNR